VHRVSLADAPHHLRFSGVDVGGGEKVQASVGRYQLDGAPVSKPWDRELGDAL
jgi:hypothetical protein